MVSVVIPTYNAEKTLLETINSVLSQTYQDWELLIIDDGSSDGSKAIAQSFCSKDSRIKYHHQKNAGVSKARNFGLSIASGDIVAFLDSDDLWLSNFLEKKVAYLEQNENVGAVTSSVRFIDKDSNPIEGMAYGMTTQDVEGILKFKNKNKTTGPSGILCKKKHVEKIGGFNSQLSNTADKMFYLDLSKETEIATIKEVLWVYRFHDASMHKNIVNMINDYESFIKQLELKSYFQSKSEKRLFKKYIYGICAKESVKNKFLNNSIIYTLKYFFA